MTTDTTDHVQNTKDHIDRTLKTAQNQITKSHDAATAAAVAAVKASTPKATRKAPIAAAQIAGDEKRDAAVQKFGQAATEFKGLTDEALEHFLDLCVSGRETVKPEAIKAIKTIQQILGKIATSGIKKNDKSIAKLSDDSDAVIDVTQKQLNVFLIHSAKVELGGDINNWKTICLDDIDRAIQSKIENPGKNAVSDTGRIETAGTTIYDAAETTFNTFEDEYFTWDPKDPNFAQLAHLLNVKRTIRSLIVTGKEVEKQGVNEKGQPEPKKVTQNIANRPKATVQNVTDALATFEDDAARIHMHVGRAQGVSTPDAPEKTRYERVFSPEGAGVAAGAAIGGLIGGPFGLAAGAAGGGLIANGTRDVKSRLKRTVAGAVLVMSAFVAAAATSEDGGDTSYENAVQKRAQEMGPSAPLKIKDYIYQPDSP